MVFDEEGLNVAVLNERAHLNNKEVLTVPQAAELTNVKRQAIYIAIAKGSLKAHKLGKQWYISRSDLDYYRSHRYDRTYRSIGGIRLFDPTKGTMSIRQLCKRMREDLGCKYAYNRAYYAMQQGYLKSHKHGSSWIIKEEDYRAFREHERNTKGMMVAR